MTQTTRPASTNAAHSSDYLEPSGMTAWVGWIAFAGTMMTMLGLFHIFQGFVAIFSSNYYQVGEAGLVLHVSYTGWGIVHLIGGVIIVAAGVALFSGKVWARSVAVVLALVSAIVNIGFLSAYPIWSTIMITIDILVIWALTVHGAELKE